MTTRHLIGAGTFAACLAAALHPLALTRTSGLAGPQTSSSAQAAPAASTELERATRIVDAINVGLRDPKSAERNAKLEALVDALDAMSDAVFTQKLNAHSRLNGYYRADDIDAGIIKHSTWIIDAAAKRPAGERTTLAGVVLSAHENLAEAWAGQDRTADALALLDRALTNWADLPAARLAGVRSTRDRYRLVGTMAPAITAPVWINGAAAATSLPMTGAVTLLEFTAHWCGPCKESYPGVKRLLAAYGPQGFRVVLATRLYGYFGSERNLPAEDELARDREYFAKEGMNVPIAVAGKAAPSTQNPDGIYISGDRNEAAYKVGGIPQIHIIDRQGRVRLIMVGYDDANEPKLATFIARLLAER